MDETNEAPRAAFTIHEFCDRNGISPNTYHKMKSAGRGPIEMRIPATTIVRITSEAERAWQQRWENPSPEDAAEIERARERMVAKATYSVNERDRKNGRRERSMA
ncbi:hypothetical protein NKI19_03235 [Mesorhizobium sp. M0751]|uniref:hypothetical protein n=1 Tax=unclassified Mesorhizobium TaxID=325217 RepID=UPI0033374255